MLYRLFFLVLLTMVCASVQGQTIISQFGWNGGPVTVADVGPNATSISGSAVSDINGTSGTNGLNAGLPKLDLNMVIPGSPTFDVNGIDISFDYQREESVGTFWRRGSSVIINGCNRISVSYRVDDGAGGYLTVNSGNVYNIPNDNTFRRYRFIYIPSSGFGYVLVNGSVVWSDDGPNNRNLYWTGAGDVNVGNGMDGTGFNNTFLDSLVVADVVTFPLPIELVGFNAENKEDKSVLTTWTTASELNNDFFTIERSQNGLNWEEIGTVKGAGSSTKTLSYEFVDDQPYTGISYYRLKQTDFDGRTEVFDIRSVNIEQNKAVKAFPNPFERFCFVNEYNSELQIYSIDGTNVSDLILKIETNNGTKLDFESISSGVYILIQGDSRTRIVHL